MKSVLFLWLLIILEARTKHDAGYHRGVGKWGKNRINSWVGKTGHFDNFYKRLFWTGLSLKLAQCSLYLHKVYFGLTVCSASSCYPFYFYFVNCIAMLFKLVVFMWSVRDLPTLPMISFFHVNSTFSKIQIARYCAFVLNI